MLLWVMALRAKASIKSDLAGVRARNLGNELTTKTVRGAFAATQGFEWAGVDSQKRLHFRCRVRVVTVKFAER